MRHASKTAITCALLTVAQLLHSTAATGAEPANLVKNGNFEQGADGDGNLKVWGRHQGVSLASEGGNSWLVIDRYAGPSQVIAIAADWWKLSVECRMRTTDVVIGDEGWKNARLAMNFVDDAQRHVDPWPPVFNASGTTPWTHYKKEFSIPKGSSALIINPSMLGASGRAEFDDIVVTVSRKRSTMQDNVPIPKEVERLWDLTHAWSVSSETRESICLNDLWRFLPLTGEAEHAVPPAEKGWGWFKVPGIWPRSPSGEAQDALVPGYVEENTDFNALDQAWYKREITIPRNWDGRRVLVEFQLLQTHARLFIDGAEAGEVFFPGGHAEITSRVEPGSKHELAILVTARPFEKESKAFMAPDRIITSQASVALRGITSDVYLSSEPRGSTISDVHVITTTRDMKIAFDTGLRDLERGRYTLRADVSDAERVVESFESEEFGEADLARGRTSFSSVWRNAKLWDTHTPGNQYSATVSLYDSEGTLVDQTLPTRFGFREFRITGRDFYLNDKRIRLRALNVSNISRTADLASKESCLRTCDRLRDYGFNFFITSNYHFKPGAVGHMEGLLDAADEKGILMAFSLPHLRDFTLDMKDPASFDAFTRLTEHLIRQMQNHPSAILYAMSHNATGYKGDQNPLRIDGVFRPDDTAYEGAHRSEVREAAEFTGSIVNSLDPTRPAYHHQSGNLGAMHTVNIYLNWAPLQERSDWLEHWGTQGRKPLFFVEWGLPHISSWSSYRGPHFIWRTDAYQQIWDSEYAAAYNGEKAYEMTVAKVKSMAHEEYLWSRGQPFAWGWLIQHLSQQEENYRSIQALFADDNWRAHRTWGISAMLPWDQGGMWYGRSRGAEIEDSLADLKTPGIKPDRLFGTGDYLDALDAEGVKPSSLGTSFLRWNKPTCAYIGGGPERFTEKGHNFTVGETIEKQLVMINDTREELVCKWSWQVSPGKWRKNGRARIAPGTDARVPVSIQLRKRTDPGAYRLTASFEFGRDDVQTDELAIHVMPDRAAPLMNSRMALFDPEGATASLLDELGVSCTRVQATSDLDRFDVLIVGRGAITTNNDAPDISRIADGLKVLVFEQSYEALVNRLGFRANIHGARRAFARVRDHPALAGLTNDHLRDWRGAATLVPPHLDIKDVEQDNPRWSWCGYRNTRVWRCGNEGSVASILIEKPPRGNFIPLVDCEFDLQYTPLLEYVEGKGRAIFCQLDVTGRTRTDPAARALVVNLLGYLESVQPPTFRHTFYEGGALGRTLLSDLGVHVEDRERKTLSSDGLLVIGPEAAAIPELDAAISGGLNVLCIGLDGAGLERMLPGTERPALQPTIPSMVEDLTREELAGISAAEFHWKTLLPLPALMKMSADSNQALRVIERGRGRIVLCQAAPWMFDYAEKPYLRTTYRRNVYLVSRLLSNLGARMDCPLVKKLSGAPVVFEFELPQSWKGLVDRDDAGRDRGWHMPHFDDSAWKPIKVPGAFDQQVPGLQDYDGLFWYRITFRVPESMAERDLSLFLGGIDDESWIWLNGRYLGEVTKETNPKDYWSFPRRYDMKPGMLNRGGDNVLVVRCLDTYMSGGITGKPRLTAPGPWLQSYYVQDPQAVDDPYRYYRW